MFPKIGVPPNHPILIRFSIINHPFWGTTIFGNIHFFVWVAKKCRFSDAFLGQASIQSILLAACYSANTLGCCDGWKTLWQPNFGTLINLEMSAPWSACKKQQRDIARSVGGECRVVVMSLSKYICSILSEIHCITSLKFG